MYKLHSMRAPPKTVPSLFPLLSKLVFYLILSCVFLLLVSGPLLKVQDEGSCKESDDLPEALSAFLSLLSGSVPVWESSVRTKMSWLTKGEPL